MIYIAVAPSHWNILEPPPHPLTCRCSTAGAHCDGCQHHHELESGGDWASFGVPRKVPWKHSFSYVAMAKHYNGHLENCGWLAIWWCLRRKYQKLFQWTVMAPLSWEDQLKIRAWLTLSHRLQKQMVRYWTWKNCLVHWVPLRRYCKFT